MDEEPRQTKGQDGSSSKVKAQKDSGSSVSNTPRKRVSQACDRCRSRKDKCDGKKPVCSTCAALDQVCSYDPATKKRGLPEGYVRGLEKLWGLTIREAAGVEETILNTLNGGEDGNDFEALSRVWNDREGTETLLETWRKSKISRELERLLPILDLVEDKPGKRKRPGSSSTRAEGGGDVSDALPRLSGADQKPSIEVPYWNLDDLPSLPSAHNPQRRRVVEVSTSPTEGPNISTRLPELPPRAWPLLDVFFSYTHCWLPIIEKHDLLRTSYQYTPSGINVSTSLSGSGDHAALWAVLAYAECQNNAITNRDPKVDPQWTVDSLYSHARTLIPTEDGVFEIGHVQALLVLALINMGRNHWSRAWLLIGQAVRIAIDLGIDKEPEGDAQHHKSADKKSRSKHVFLGCFALDTLIAARLGRRPQLRKNDAERVGPVEEDGLDEWNPWTDCLALRQRIPDGPHGPTAVLSTFNRLIILLKILNSVICDVPNGARRVEHCKELLRELDSWGQVLPALLDPSSKPPLLPHRFHLHLAHISTMAVVYSHLTTCSNEMNVSSSTIAETFVTTARQTMWLLMRQSENFGLLIAPPTYDYFTKIACESAQKVQDGLADAHLTYTAWQQNMEQSLASMGKTWPTFEILRDSLKTSFTDTIYQYQSPPATAFSRGSFEISQQIPSHTKHLSINNNVFNFSGGLNQSPLTPTDFSAQATSSFSQTQYNPLLNLAASGGLQGVEGSSPTWPDQNLGRNLFTEQPSADQLQFPDGSLGSDIDGDSMFNDFATLDAMEWSVHSCPSQSSPLSNGAVWIKVSNISIGQITGTKAS
jgi:hypothetical protein